MKKAKLLPLYVAIAAGLYGVSQTAIASCDISGDIKSTFWSSCATDTSVNEITIKATDASAKIVDAAPDHIKKINIQVSNNPAGFTLWYEAPQLGADIITSSPISRVQFSLDGYTKIIPSDKTINIKDTGNNGTQIKSTNSLAFVAKKPFIDSGLPFLSTGKLVSYNSGSLPFKLILDDTLTLQDIYDKDIKLIEVTGISGTTGIFIDGRLNGYFDNNDIKLEDSNGSEITINSATQNLTNWLSVKGGKTLSKTTQNGKGYIILRVDSEKVTPNSKEAFLNLLSSAPTSAEYLFAKDFILPTLISTNSAELKDFFVRNPDPNIISRQMLPDLSGGDIEAAFNYVEKMRSHIGNRTLRYSNQLPEEEREHGWNLWVTTDYSTGKNNDTYGYKLNRYGVQVGIDQQINDQALLGFSLGLNRNNVKNNVSSSKKTTQFVFMPYYEWRNGFYFAEINSDFGILSTQSRRNIGDTTASGSYSSFQFGYQVLGGIETAVYNDVYIKPYAGLKYQWITNQGWHEEGSPLALAYDSQKYAARHVGGGFSIWKAFEMPAGSFVPSLDIEYYRVVGRNDKISQNVDLASSVPETGSAKGQYLMTGNALFGNQLSMKLNASLDLSPTFNITGSAGYNRFGEYKESVFGLTLSNRF